MSGRRLLTHARPRLRWIRVRVDPRRGASTYGRRRGTMGQPEAGNRGSAVEVPRHARKVGEGGTARRTPRASVGAPSPRSEVAECWAPPVGVFAETRAGSATDTRVPPVGAGACARNYWAAQREGKRGSGPKWVSAA